MLVMATCLASGPCCAARTTSLMTATVFQGLAVAQVTGLGFGGILPGASGTVVLAPDGSRQASDGITLVGAGPSPCAAEFSVSGQQGASYYIVLPDSLDISDGRQSLTVGEFTSSPKSSGLLAAGAGTVKVGATLHIIGDQAPGAYEAEFDVVLSYN